MLKKLKKALMGKNNNQETPPTTEKEPGPNQKTTLRTHYTKTEMEMIQKLAEEGASNREIAIKMNRTVSGIRALRHKRGLAGDDISPPGGAPPYKRIDQIEDAMFGLIELLYRAYPDELEKLHPDGCPSIEVMATFGRMVKRPSKQA